MHRISTNQRFQAHEFRLIKPACEQADRFSGFLVILDLNDVGDRRLVEMQGVRCHELAAKLANELQGAANAIQSVGRSRVSLVLLRQRLRIAGIGVMHLRKSEGDALYKIANSIAFVALARTVWGIGRQPDDPTKRVLVPIKNSLAPLGSALGFRIETVDGTARIAWEGELNIAADSVIGVTHQEKRSNAKKLDDVADWLKETLRDGAMAEKEIRAKAETAGHKWRTLWRGKERLNVRSVKPSFGGGWFWELPKRGGHQ